MSDLSGSAAGLVTGFDGLDRVIGGVLHYACVHAGISRLVHSYYVAPARVLIDPMAPAGIAEMLRPDGVDRVILSNRHHYRGAGEIAATFACSVHAPAVGLREFSGDRPVVGYEWGEELAPGVTAYELGAISPDDGAIHIAIGAGALAFADGLLSRDGALALMPDSLMDDPEQVKSDTRARLEALLELDFDALLFAHGEPISSGGKRAIESFLAG